MNVAKLKSMLEKTIKKLDGLAPDRVIDCITVEQDGYEGDPIKLKGLKMVLDNDGEKDITCLVIKTSMPDS